MFCRSAVLVCVALAMISHASAAIKVACVGDSITEGFGSSNYSTEPYPAVLQSLLGSAYDVHNYGRSGACILRAGNQPYANDSHFAAGTNLQPDIVAIMLGTNDGKPYNWAHSPDFTNDLQYLVDAYLACTSQPTIIICAPCPALGDGYDISASTVNNEIIPRIRNYAAVHGFTVVDVNARMTGHPEWFGDPIHPNVSGYAEIADVVRDTITNLVAADPASVLLSSGASWKYYNTGSLPATNWFIRTYGDGSWSNGAAPLGYNDPALVTTLGYGGVDSNRWVTYFFRHSFVLTNTAVVTGLTASLIADDGAVVYLNGTKVHTTTNMPEPSDNGSFATPPSVEPYVPETFTLNPSQLVVGTNVVAVEVHQTGPASSDVYFDMSLSKVGHATTNQLGGGFPVSTNASTNVVNASAGWVAYNDLGWQSGQTASQITTNSMAGLTTGSLKDYTSGTNLGVQVTLGGTALSFPGNGTNPPAGTEAAIVFTGKVTCVGYANWSTGTVTLRFDNLTPGQRYSFALYGSRGDSNYTYRWTDVQIVAATSFVNNSSVGSTILTNAMPADTARILAANMDGKLWRFDNILPAADGHIQFNATAGGSSSTGGYLNAFMLSMVGNSTNIDMYGVPDTWKLQYFGSTNVNVSADTDDDGSDNYSEYRAGTDPTQSGSKFEMTSLSGTNVPGTAVFRWSSVSNKTYAVLFGTNLLTPLTSLQSGLAATPPVNVYTASASTIRGFLRIKVE